MDTPNPIEQIGPDSVWMVGREAELERLFERVQQPDVRLITLVGPPGVGKSHLMRALRQRGLGQESYLVGMLELGDSDYLFRHLAKALRTPVSSDGYEELSRYFASRKATLFLDNLEHLPGAPEAIKRLVEIENLTLVCASQTPLGLAEEEVVAIQPLQLPSLDEPLNAYSVLQLPAVRLFAQRAKVVRPGFVVSDENAATIARLCSYLDGLPLALELAAARLNVLSPEAMVQRLEKQQSLPGASYPHLEARHRDLDSAIRWSYELLSPRLQKVLRRLAVFSGGWSLEAAKKIALEALHLDPLEAMTALIDRSLIYRVEGGSEPRFDMLISVRSFALKQLQHHRELDSLRTRHRVYCLELAQAAHNAFGQAGFAELYNQIEGEYPNFRSALIWAAEEKRGDLLAPLVLALTRFWWNGRHLVEARHWFERALNLIAEPQSSERIYLNGRLGAVLVQLGEVRQARQRLQTALSLRQPGQPDPWLAGDLNNLSLVALLEGHLEEAEELCKKTLEVASPTFVQPFINLGEVAYRRADYTAAEGYFARVVAIKQGAADQAFLGEALLLLGKVYTQSKDYAKAAARFDESIAVLRDQANAKEVAYALIMYARLERVRGDFARARILLYESWDLLIANEQSFAAGWLETAANLAARQNQPLVAAGLWGVAEVLAEHKGTSMIIEAEEEHQRLIALSRQQTTMAEFEQAWTQGRLVPPAERLHYGKALFQSLVCQRPDADGFDEHGRDLLSPREKEVMALLIQGLSNKGIGKELCISERTAKYHVTSILNKLGAMTRTQAVAMAAKLDLVAGNVS